MKTLMFFVILGLVIYSISLIAAPSREAGWIDAPPIVAYGKDSTGVLRALLVASDGTVQTA